MKSKVFTGVIGLALGLILSACSDSDINLPHVFGGNEVPPEVRDEPRLVVVPPPRDPANESWPRLGDVPAAPKNFSPQNSIDAARAQMEQDRADARALLQQQQQQ